MGNQYILGRASICFCFLMFMVVSVTAQVPSGQDTTTKPIDTIPVVRDTVPVPTDTVLRIKNLNPFFTLHVDSTLQYNLEINKEESGYYWFLRNSPVGLRINKDN